MSSTDAKKVEELLKLAVKYKASRIKVGTIEVDVSPVAYMSAQSVEELKAAMEPDGLCKCGHEFSSHNHAGCLHGCAVEKCVPDEEKE